MKYISKHSDLLKTSKN